MDRFDPKALQRAQIKGTSYHYAAPDTFAEADRQLIARTERALREARLRTYVGSSWMTDAPFRETAEAIAVARANGVLAVEMEAAALYTLAHRGKKAVLASHRSLILWDLPARISRRAKRREPPMP